MKRKAVLLLGITALLVASGSASLSNPSEVEVRSGNEFFAGYNDPVLMFSYYANDLDSGQAVIQPSTINSKITEGEVGDGVTIGVEPQKSEAIYPLRDINLEAIRTVDAKTNTWYYDLSSSSTPSVERRNEIIRNWVSQNCDDINGDGSITYHNRGWVTGIWNTEQHYKVACFVWNEKKADVLDISSSYREKMDVEVTVGDETKTLTNMRTGDRSGESVADSSEIAAGKSATFGNFAKATFEGAFDSGYNWPVADNSYVANSDSLGYRVISQENYQTYQSNLGELENSGILEEIAKGNANPQEVRDSSESAANVALSTFTNSELFSHSFNFEGASQNARIMIEGDRRTNYPLIRFVVKGESVSYTIPDATPALSIASSQPVDIEEGGTETFDVEVSNTGTGAADFIVSVHSCTSGFTPLDTSVEAEPAPGSSVTKEFEISYGSSSKSDERGSCTVTVENLQDDTEDVSEEVELNGLQSNECEPNHWFTRGNTIYKCSSDGQQEIEKDTCTSQETFDRRNGKIVCVSQPEICGNGIDDDGDGKVDEDCSDGTVTKWIPNKDETACMSEEFPETSVPDPSFNSERACQDYLDGDPPVKCLISFQMKGPVGQGQNIELLCFKQSFFNKSKLVIILVTSISFGAVGYRIGQGLDGERDIQGRNKYASRRPNIDREARGKQSSNVQLSIIGLVVGLAVGAGIGWYLGYWSIAVAAGLLLAKYLIPAY